MNWHLWIRQSHRWVSIIFTVTVIANFVARGLGSGEPEPWLTYSPLPPLFLQLVTGLYLFVLPYTAKGRSRPGA
jgi:hypothetical protein